MMFFQRVNRLLILLIGIVLYLFAHQQGWIGGRKLPRPLANQYPVVRPTNAGSDEQQPHSTANLTTLRQLVLSPDVDYAQVHIHVRTSSSAKPPAEGSTPLQIAMPEPQTFALHRLPPSHDAIPYCCTPSITLTFPPLPPRADASNLLIGLATTLEKLNASLASYTHWAADTGVRFYAFVPPPTTKPDAPPGEAREKVQSVEKRAASMGLQVHVKPSDLDHNDRFFMLLKFLHAYKRKEDGGGGGETRGKKATTWAVIMDDDTFFISMQALLDKLATIDHTGKHYVGGLSEDLVHVQKVGAMGYGGAGIFISVGLLDAMQPYMEECFWWGEKYPTGDARIAGCIHAVTGIQIEWDSRFHQLDVKGDMSGFFESGRAPPLSVKQHRSWPFTPLEKLAAVSGVCGDACLLSRWRFADGWYLTNGFSVVKYWDEGDIAKTAVEDITVEKTWWEEERIDGRYDHSFGKTRSKDERKASMKLEDAIVEDGGARIRQIYIRRGDVERNDRVLEVVWERERN